jgi:hypothetical protein
MFTTLGAEGFIHNGRIVYALDYQLETPPPASRHLIVWIDRKGDALAPWIKPGVSDRRIVTTKPGQYILFKGQREKVVAVSVYRSLPCHVPQEPAAEQTHPVCR